MDLLSRLRRVSGYRSAILANTAYLSAARILQLAVAFTVGISVARYLGPSGAGVLAYAVSFGALFSNVASLGLDSIVVRDLAAMRHNAAAEGKVLGSAFLLRLIASPATLAAIVIASTLVNEEGHIRTLVLIVGIGVLFQPITVADLYFQSRLQSKYVVYAQTVALTISSMVRVALIYLQAPLIWFAMSLLLEAAASMVVLAWLYQRQYRNLRFVRASKSVALRLLSEAWPLAISGILGSIYVNIDRVLIKQLLGDASAGKYSIVASLSTALYFIPIAFGQSLFPSLVMARENTALYHQRLQRAFDVLFWIGIAFAVPVTFVAEPMVRLLYGPAYAGAGEVLAILIWGAVLTFVGLVTSYWLVAENLQKLYPVRLLACLGTSVSLNLLLIPRWGISGAAVATVTAQFVGSTVVYGFSRKTWIMVRMQLRAVSLPMRLWTSRSG